MENYDSMGVALIGAGMIGKTHVAALSAASDRTALRAVLSRHPERAEYLAEYYQGDRPEFTSDLSRVTEAADIQMAIVATPPSIRIDLIERLAKAGKHILLEKPVARTLEEAVRVVEICEDAGVTLGVVFQHRARAPSLAARQKLAEGAFGRLGHVEISAPLWRDQSYYEELGRGTYARDGGGVLLTQAIHTIDLALSLTGPVSRVHAMTATTPLHRMEAEDLAVGGLHFATGAVGSLVASTASYPQRKEVISLHFENGSMRLGTDRLDVVWRDGRQEDALTVTGSEGDTGAVVNKHEWHQAVIEDFVDAVRQGRAPMVTGREALHSHRLIDAIERSSREGRPIDILV
ncbi:putative dehydrogenase [Primorskyibacter sedentarius]|uniref:Putative dehydrogenase n=1 Tax=Primorskyibacter sedentarius TaxID=745311 RepID=A0A4R3JJV1_9RHOB|nr:Gfo/Idh/MocA family oxidoreductase [Primorskyibacter sedentarius]TCS65805.1 putative dehydrogenase [Primorskyibacter sedentarius]